MVSSSDAQTAKPTMNGNLFLGINHSKPNYKWTERPFPKILHPHDVIGRVHKTTICGTDLHILGGNVLDMGSDPGEVNDGENRLNPHGNVTLGHEGIIDVIAVGSSVKKFQPGDRILCCCISSCGNCKPCKKKQYGNCLDEVDGSWSLGHTINGMQAEFVRVPHADNSCYKLPSSCRKDSEDEDKYLMLADILPTSYEIGLLDGGMQPGKTLAVVGCGPVGLAAILATSAMFPGKNLVSSGVSKKSVIIAIDLDAGRLALARDMGATFCIQIDPKNDVNYLKTTRDAVIEILNEVHGEKSHKYNISHEEDGFDDDTDEVPDGLDLVIEAVGLPSGWEVSQELVKPGGNIAVLGVHGKPVTLNLERMWYRNFTLTAGMCHGYSIPDLMEKVEDGSLKAEKLITHRWRLSEVEEAYELFASRKNGVLKMLLWNDSRTQYPQEL